MLAQDLTPLEIVLDKEAWMDEIPEDDMLMPQCVDVFCVHLRKFQQLESKHASPFSSIVLGFGMAL